MNRLLRPLLVNSGLGYGGAETQLISLVRELKRRGHEPHVYLLTRLATRKGELADLDVPIITDEKRGKIDLGVISRIRAYIKTNNIDLIHSFLFDANIYSRIAGVGLKIPILNAERSSNYQLSASQMAAHVLTRWRVDGVIANTHAGRSFAQGLYRIPACHTHVTWNGIDLIDIDRRCRATTNDYKTEFFGTRNIKMAVFIGSVSESKDHALALAVSEVLISADPSWRVIFIGDSFDGSQFGYRVAAVSESAQLASGIEERRQSLQNRDKILFVGRRNDAIEIISQSNVLFSTSIREGFPNAVLEAMAVGTPVISTNYSDIKLILETDDWISSSRDPSQMAKMMIAVNDDRITVGEKLRTWVEKNATINKATDAVIEIYRNYADVNYSPT